jgi:hypothetical protein
MRAWLLFALPLALLLVACSQPREIYTEISNPSTTEELSATECTRDEDCILHDANYGWGCCWAGYCDSINYSGSNWIPLNSKWLSQEKAKWCLDECGPAPACPTRISDAGYAVVCADGVCVKTKT